MRTGLSHTAGFVVADIGNPYFAAVCRGVESILQSHDYSLLLVNSDGDLVREQQAIASLRTRRVDGLILSVASEQAPYLVELVRSVPAVLVDRVVPGTEADVVQSDHAAGMGAAMRHLVSLGHRRIAMLAASMDQFGTRGRVEACVTAAAKLGIPQDQLVIRTGVAGPVEARATVNGVLAARTPPTAIIAASYDLIVASVEVIHERGLDIPHEISFVSCEDFDLCRLHVPQLAVIKRDMFRLGSRAAELLVDRLHNPGELAVQSRVELPTRFLPRGSTAPPKE